MSEQGAGAPRSGPLGTRPAADLRAPAGPAAREPAAGLWLARATIVIGWGLILSGLGLFGSECVMWLRDGYWTHSDLADLWGRTLPSVDGTAPGWEEMRGLHLILREVLRALGRVPVGVALVAVGLGLARWGSDRHDRAEARAMRDARARQGPRPSAGAGGRAGPAAPSPRRRS